MEPVSRVRFSLATPKGSYYNFLAVVLGKFTGWALVKDLDNKVQVKLNNMIKRIIVGTCIGLVLMCMLGVFAAIMSPAEIRQPITQKVLVSAPSVTPPAAVITVVPVSPNVEVKSTITSSSLPTFYTVTGIVDGDTIKISMDGSVETLRLMGMDTPETVDPRKSVQCFGKEASDKAKELLSGRKIRIETDITQGARDKYDRLLAYVYRDDGLFYNKSMIEQGYAHEYTYNLPYKYQSEFKSAQVAAQSSHLGLWSPNTCDGDTVSSPTPSSPNSVQIQTTGKYYTSSFSTAKYYYPEACDGWKSLSKANLKSFDSVEALLAAYPARVKNSQCQ